MYFFAKENAEKEFQNKLSAQVQLKSYWSLRFCGINISHTMSREVRFGSITFLTNP